VGGASRSRIHSSQSRAAKDCGTGRHWDELGGTGKNRKGIGRHWERPWGELGGTGKDSMGTGRHWDGLGGTGKDSKGIGRHLEGPWVNWEALGRIRRALVGTGKGPG